MAEIITKKSQIPEYARKNIENFSKLTDNQAIFEYELIKLKRRAKSTGVKLPPIFRPARVTKEAIKQLHEIRGKKLKELEPIENPPKPKPKPEPIDIVADSLDQARAFIDALKQSIIDAKNATIISYSSYASGRTRTARSRSWITDNITRATNMLITLLDNITATDESMLAFARRFMDNDSELATLQDAIGEYIHNSYSVIDTSSYLHSSDVYRILVGRPLTLQETMKLSQDEEWVEDEE